MGVRSSEFLSPPHLSRQRGLGSACALGDSIIPTKCNASAHSSHSVRTFLGPSTLWPLRSHSKRALASASNYNVIRLGSPAAEHPHSVLEKVEHKPICGLRVSKSARVWLQSVMGKGREWHSGPLHVVLLRIFALPTYLLMHMADAAVPLLGERGSRKGGPGIRDSRRRELRRSLRCLV